MNGAEHPRSTTRSPKVPKHLRWYAHRSRVSQFLFGHLVVPLSVHKRRSSTPQNQDDYCGACSFGRHSQNEGNSVYARKYEILKKRVSNYIPDRTLTDYTFSVLEIVRDLDIKTRPVYPQTSGPRKALRARGKSGWAEECIQIAINMFIYLLAQRGFFQTIAKDSVTALK